MLPDIGGGGISGVSDGRGLAEGDDAGEKGLGYRRGGKASLERVSDIVEGERMSLTFGEASEVFLRDTACVSWGQPGHGSLFVAKSMQFAMSLIIWSRTTSDST